MSLILMTQKGLPVPQGFVLPVDFFQPWLEYVQATPEWTGVPNSPPEELKQNCDALKALSAGLELDDMHREVLAKTLEPLKADDRPPLFAVRSSSPEEDLEGASFAGGYETVLGVREDGLEDALRRSFASCLDERVFLYKKVHGFAVDRPRIAVVVQQQIAAQTAGVAFSLNPVNNCYDEAVINANFGIGESVVSGMVSPDSFIVDKVSRAILDRKAGKKETSVWLAPDGGTYEEPSPSRSQLCLSDEEVLELTRMLIKVEDYYKKPVDIEWAIAHNKLYLLQARPVTAYVPLPEVMLTRPGEPKRLYLDATLVKQGIQSPLSALGTDYLAKSMRAMFRDWTGSDKAADIQDGLFGSFQGRGYTNLSNTLKMQGKKRVAWIWGSQDALSAEIIENLDEKEYIPKKLPRRLRGLAFGIVVNGFDAGWKTLKAVVSPGKYHAYFREETKKLVQNLEEERERELPIGEFALNTTRRFVRYVNDVSLPVTYAAEIARSRIKRLFRNEKPEIRDKVVYLEQALPHNVTIEMGLAMYRLACFKEIKDCASGKEFASRMESRSFSAGFLEAWDDFMKEYGHRCPKEMDVASPRFYEMPEQVFNQLRAMSENTDEEHNPQAVFDKGLVGRQEAYEFLLGVARSKGKRREKQLRRYYNILVTFGAYREIHKYYYIMVIDMIRKRVLSAGESLLEVGRLDSPEQVFDLTIDDLANGLVDPLIDLRALAQKNTRFLRQIQHIRNFPRIIDSRGRILHPPKKEAAEGELVGEPISPGKARGQVKVLNRPDEKPVLPGEILVARATDPGWTPLFLNAGGIVLEVGGLLQHGALVAREYAKPCVAGIENVTSILSDGQVVEIDGLRGVVRFM